MTNMFGGVERPGPWETTGDHERRIRALEASLVCCVPSGQTLEQIILANPCLVSFWKLDETTGDIAVDSQDGFDMDSGAGIPPTWAAATTPYGALSPRFNGQTSGELLEATAFPTLAADLAVEIWGRRLIDDGGFAMINQGDPWPLNGLGVGIGWLGSGSGYAVVGSIGSNPGSPQQIILDELLPGDDWHHFVLTRESNIWTFYVDAVEIGTYDDGGTNYSATTGMQIGNIAGSLVADNFDGNLSYGAAYDCALSSTEVAQHYTAGISGETGGIVDGWVLTADSTADEGWSWQPSTIEVLEDGV